MSHHLQTIIVLLVNSSTTCYMDHHHEQSHHRHHGHHHDVHCSSSTSTSLCCSHAFSLHCSCTWPNIQPLLLTQPHLITKVTIIIITVTTDITRSPLCTMCIMSQISKCR